MQEILEQEKAENFRLQPLPDVFESLLSRDAEHPDVAVSQGGQAGSASMEEDRTTQGSPDLYQSAGPSGTTSARVSPDVWYNSPSVATDSLHAADSPDPTASANKYRSLPAQNLKFIFLGGSYG